MNNTFNIKRFGLLLRKDFLENGKRYLLQFLTLFGIIAVFIFWISYQYYTNGINHNWSIMREMLTNVSVLFCIFGTLCAATLTEPMRDKIRRIAYLANPASNFEKMLSRWLIVTIGYVIAFFAALWLADAVRVAAFSISYPEIDIPFLDFGFMYPAQGSDFSGFVFTTKHLFIACLGFYFFLQSLFVLGATFWAKGTFIKTFSTGVLVVLLFLLLCYWAILLSYDEAAQFPKVLDSFEMDGHVSQEQVLPFITCVFGLFALINWTLAFFRFRESEIIKRL